MEIGLSLGSNLGDRLATLRDAVTRISRLPGIRLVAAAPLYETDPVDVRPEYDSLRYLNTVIIINAPDSCDLRDLSDNLHAIETALGRVRSSDRNAPRTLDIDVLYAGTLIRADGILDLPHPRWAQRRFVVQPLADVRPALQLPGETQTVSATLATLPDTGISRFETNAWPPSATPLATNAVTAPKLAPEELSRIDAIRP
jgi:2-amino-4-hydroxy-6-hydroxymethyldihydropteridine diphosphokinase